MEALNNLPAKAFRWQGESVGRAEGDKLNLFAMGLNFGGADGFNLCTSLPFLSNVLIHP